MRRSLGEKTFDAVNTVLLLGVIAISFYPMLYVLNSSISDPERMLRSRSFMLTPEGFQLDAYAYVLKNPKILQGYLNTLFYVSAGTLVNLIMTSLAAYTLSRPDLLGRKTMMKLITFTMFFGGGMIPSFLLVQNLGLVDTRWAIIIPGAISTFYFLIMKTSFEGLPISLIESAKLDGANDLLILARIVLPLSKPILAVMTLYYAVDHWNDFVGPMLYLRSQELYPIQIVMRDILISSSTEAMGAGIDTGFALGENIKYATIIVSTLPIMLLYPFIQRFFVQGALIGAVKQ
ncbi:carbohydrate ABC transporter permease [Paenibacillus sp. FSL W8-1187]|uniref:Xylose ABC transporter, permease component n=1 Tax=Paenibacillus pasadenensis TaxID=217090 RepID=A0A2N5N8M9_9BACL|nr:MULTISPECIES: carbohydrate ABC transporter permease [Paenibacillus]PLT46694.1 Xylose ABC transporter, permease component [Paenibacillus pasadenensis]QGG57084.1 ABC transporter permease subunit [Paenibacillus sp. B01]